MASLYAARPTSTAVGTNGDQTGARAHRPSSSEHAGKAPSNKRCGTPSSNGLNGRPDERFSRSKRQRQPGPVRSPVLREAHEQADRRQECGEDGKYEEEQEIPAAHVVHRWLGGDGTPRSEAQQGDRSDEGKPYRRSASHRGYERDDEEKQDV